MVMLKKKNVVEIKTCILSRTINVLLITFLKGLKSLTSPPGKSSLKVLSVDPLFLCFVDVDGWKFEVTDVEGLSPVTSPPPSSLSSSCFRFRFIRLSFRRNLFGFEYPPPRPPSTGTCTLNLTMERMTHIENKDFVVLPLKSKRLRLDLIKLLGA